MSARIWFNTRVLCCEESPELAATLVAAKARVTFAPLRGEQPEGAWKVRSGDWANPDYPFALVEGHEVVLLRWPSEPRPAEEVRWWVSGALHLAESARRSRVRALGFQGPLQADPLLLHAGRFLQTYFQQLPIRVVCSHESLLAQVEAGFAGR